MEPEQLTKAQSSIFLPVSILAAAVLISGSVVWSAQRNAGFAPDPLDPQAAAPTGDLEQMAPVTASDHVRGNPDAPVKIVEYADTECPFCKSFHATLKDVQASYGSEQVAWVYRHFPLDQLHAKARREAVATECAAEQGGNDGFWAYLDRLFAITPSNDGLDLAELPKIAEYIGLDVAKFNECLDSGRYDDHIESEAQNAMATGGSGTPWSIVVGPDGKKYPLSGALPVDALRSLIDAAMAGE